MGYQHTIPPTAPTTTKGVFDYLLDDAAVYAIFNHQIADLPNPQSPYKKDNPKTWGDGTLIDFGDGTYGIAKTITYDPTGNSHANIVWFRDSLRGIKPLVLDWGGALEAAEGTSTEWYFSIQAFNYWSPASPLIASVHADQTIDGGIHLNLIWTNGVPSKNYLTGKAWVWVIFTAA